MVRQRGKLIQIKASGFSFLNMRFRRLFERIPLVAYTVFRPQTTVVAATGVSVGPPKRYTQPTKHFSRFTYIRADFYLGY